LIGVPVFRSGEEPEGMEFCARFNYIIHYYPVLQAEYFLYPPSET
jgi:hypothetical protein